MDRLTAGELKEKLKKEELPVFLKDADGHIYPRLINVEEVYYLDGQYGPIEVGEDYPIDTDDVKAYVISFK